MWLENNVSMISRFNLGLIYAAITTVRKYYDCKKITILMIGLFFCSRSHLRKKCSDINFETSFRSQTAAARRKWTSAISDLIRFHLFHLGISNAGSRVIAIMLMIICSCLWCEGCYCLAALTCWFISLDAWIINQNDGNKLGSWLRWFSKLRKFLLIDGWQHQAMTVL